MEHDLGDAAGQEGPDGRVVMRAVGQDAHEPGDPAVDLVPVVDGRAGAGRRRRRWPGRAAAGSSSRRTRRGRSWRCGSPASVRMSRVASPARPGPPGPGPIAGPCRARSAGPEGRGPRAAGSCPSASATTWAVAAVPRNWQPPPGLAQARQPSSAASCSVSSPCDVAGADRLDLAGVLAVARRERHAAGHEHARQVLRSRQGEHHGRAGPCRRSRRRAPPSASAASGSAGGRRSPRRCGRAGCPSSPACPASGRRTGRRPSPRTATTPSARQLLGRLLDQQADLPVAGVVAQGDRRPVRAAGPPGCSGSGTGRGPPRRPSSPSPRSGSGRTGRPRANA